MGLGFATKWQLSFQDAASPIMEGIINLHHDLFAFLVFITVFVFYILSLAIFKFSDFNKSNYLTKKKEVEFTAAEATTLEVVWTIAPSLILFAIAVPSFALLYSVDEIVDPAVTLKVIGRQWYWSYEYGDYDKLISFDSFMVPEDDLSKGQLRLLEVDHRVFLPINTHVRILVTSSDVIHSWAIPALGVKIDACPGRLNQVLLFIKKPGVYYGQCSEICGTNHGFMPIAIEAVDVHKYVEYIQEALA